MWLKRGRIGAWLFHISLRHKNRDGRRNTLQGTNISPKNGILKMIFLFPRWDILIPWRVFSQSVQDNHPATSTQRPARNCWASSTFGLPREGFRKNQQDFCVLAKISTAKICRTSDLSLKTDISLQQNDGWKMKNPDPFSGDESLIFRVSGYHLKRRIFVWLLTMTPRWSPRAIDGDGVSIWEPDLDHGPPKPTYLEVFMVHGAWYLGGQNLYFSCFWGLMVYIYV